MLKSHLESSQKEAISGKRCCTHSFFCWVYGLRLSIKPTLVEPVKQIQLSVPVFLGRMDGNHLSVSPEHNPNGGESEIVKLYRSA